MFAAVRRCISNALLGGYIKKLTRTCNSSWGGLKAAVTTALLIIMGTLYCLYGSGGSNTLSSLEYTQQQLGSDSVNIQSDDIATMDNGNSVTNISMCGQIKPKKLKLKKNSGVLTAADMYDPGFRIENADLCSSNTRLLVLITSAAAPSHSQNRQAIRMTWMNRYGPSVSMAFLVGTPQMSETDPVAQILEAEEQSLRDRLNRIDLKNDILKENFKPQSNALANVSINKSDWFPFLRDRKPNLDGLDARAMHGLNKAEQAVQRVLGREHIRYKDLIQCKSRDTYTNLTLKSIAALEWTRQYCPSARYVLKTDDDMFIDIERLLRFIDKVETTAIAEIGINGLRTSKFLGTDVFEFATVTDYDIELPPTIWGRLAHGWRPIRQQNSKYYVSRTQYTGRVYPDFCTGPAYLMTRSAVNPLYEAALGKDFDVVDDENENNSFENSKDNINKDVKDLRKNCSNEIALDVSNDKDVGDSGKNSVPYLKLEDVYLTGVVAERLTRRATERQLRKKKNNDSLNGNNQKTSFDKNVSINSHDKVKKTRSNAANIIVKVRRIHDDQFANKKITGRALDRAVCYGISSGDTANTNGVSNFSWFRWFWGDTAVVDKDSKKKKKDQGVISLHMVKYFEQFDLWRRLMDTRTKCKS